MSEPDTRPGILLIAGLGNPGARYRNNRHNAGLWFADQLARQYNAQFTAQSKFHGSSARIETASGLVWLFKPALFMNESGRALSAFVNFHKLPPAQVLIAHDEIDFEAGRVRLKNSGGTGGHNGLADIVRCLGADFWRLRIGVGHPGSSDRVSGYVLSDPAADEARLITAAITRAADVIERVAGGEFEAAMNELHAAEGGG